MTSTSLGVTRIDVETVKMKCNYLNDQLKSKGVEKFSSQVAIYQNLPEAVENIISWGSESVPKGSELLKESSKSWFFYSKIFGNLSKRLSEIDGSSFNKNDVFSIRNLYLSLLAHSSNVKLIRQLLSERISLLKLETQKNIIDVFFNSVAKAFRPIISEELKKTVDGLEIIREAFFSRSDFEKQESKPFPYKKSKVDLEQFYGEGIFLSQLQTKVYAVFGKNFSKSLEIINSVLKRAKNGRFGVKAKVLVDESNEHVVNREFLIKIILIHYFKKKATSSLNVDQEFFNEVRFTSKSFETQENTELLIQEIEKWIKENDASLEQLIKELFLSEGNSKHVEFFEKINQLVGRHTFYRSDMRGLGVNESSVKTEFDSCFSFYKYDDDEKTSQINNILVVKTFSEVNKNKAEQLDQIKTEFKKLCESSSKFDLEEKLLGIFIELVTKSFDEEIPKFIDELPKDINLSFFKSILEVWNVTDLSKGWMNFFFEKVSDSDRKIELINIYLSVQVSQNISNLPNVISLMESLDLELRKKVSLENFLAVSKVTQASSRLSRTEIQRFITLYHSIKVLNEAGELSKTDSTIHTFERNQQHSVSKWTDYEIAVDEVIKKQILENSIAAHELQEILDDLIKERGFAWRRIQAKIINHSLNNPACSSCSSFVYTIFKSEQVKEYYNAETLTSLQYAVSSVITSQIYHQVNSVELKAFIDSLRNLMRESFDESDEDFDYYLFVSQYLEKLLDHQSELKALLDKEDAASKIFDTELEGDDKYSWIYFASLFLYRKSYLQNKGLLRACLNHYPVGSIWNDLTKWLLEPSGDGHLELIC